MVAEIDHFLTLGECPASVTEEPGAGKPPAGICAGGTRQRVSLPRYNPTLGRWPSRDPIGEEGGDNLYVYVYNNAQDFVDGIGMMARPVASIRSKPFTVRVNTGDPDFGECGYFSLDRDLNISMGSRPSKPPKLPNGQSPNVEKTGWILQELEIKITMKDCDGKSLPGAHVRFIEGFKVHTLSIPGVVWWQGRMDTWQFDGSKQCTVGKGFYHARLAYYDYDRVTVPPWIITGKPPTWGTPMLPLPVGGRPFNLSHADSIVVRDKFLWSWDCCKHSGKVKGTTVEGHSKWH